ncbi:MAG: deoxyribose-phosphate aldolase [Bacteroidales bacterium]|nr:deoxyribose-phosphate aldolase [Bacteroidales bacterium]
MFKFEEYNYTAEENKTRLFSMLGESVSDQKADILKIILSCIDLTTLEGTDTDERIISLCQKAKSFRELAQGLPNVAAVCFYPPFVRTAKKELQGTGINVASVAGAFPSGQSPLNIRIQEVKFAIDEGADEIDMVISRGKYLEGNYNFIFDEIAAIKEACVNKHLKVILETGELQTIKNIRHASEIAINAGADFLKTSTGKIQPAATEEGFLVMAETVKEYFDKTGKRIGLKPAGGISTPEQATNYYLIVKHIAGEDWLNNEYFRIGASRLTDMLVEQIINNT